MMRLLLQEQKLDKLVAEIERVQDGELKSHLAKYFCILVSGYIENFVKDLISNYHEKSCKKETARYVMHKMRNLTNLDDDKILSFLGSFDSSWEDNYRNQRTDEMQSAFNSIYAQRNKIAHGNSNNSNITHSSIKMYYWSVKESLAILAKIICK